MNEWRSIFRRWVYLWAALAWLGGAVGARGADDPFKSWGAYLSQHDYRVMKVDNGGNNDQVAEARLNGQTAFLVVDTGCERTVLSADCARHLKLKVQDAGYESFGVGGAIRGHTGVALLSSFTLNNYAINRTNIITVFSKSAYVQGFHDGLLGFDFLHLNAAILPVGASFFLFKPGPGAVPPIDSYMETFGFKSVPLRYEAGGLVVEGHVNDQPLKALVDCGAAYSVFDLDYIRKMAAQSVYYLNADFRGLDGNKLDSYTFTPKRLDLGALNIKPMTQVASREPMFGERGINALLGYDLLAQHEAIIDLGHDTLWMK